MPTQPIVIIFAPSPLPQETKTDGTGAKRVLPFQCCFIVHLNTIENQVKTRDMCVGFYTLLS